MANPQKENGHIDIANEIMEAKARIRIPGEAEQVLCVIFRKTYGWNKTEDKIPLSQFEEMTGLPRPSICRAINKLLKINIITRKGNSTSLFTKKGGDTITTYAIQKDYEKWLTLTKKPTCINNNANVQHVDEKVNQTLTKKRHSNTTISNTNIYIQLFDFWNSHNIITHREIDKFVPSMKARLKSYTTEEIMNAISNYSEVLKDDKYYFTYKWGLDEFLSRKNGLDKFLGANNPFDNFRKNSTSDNTLKKERLPL
ncbi:MAG: replication protein, partial [Candidatus Anammoxibacter sp.]